MTRKTIDEKTSFSPSNERWKLLKLYMFLEELRFSSPKKGSLERMKRRLLTFKILREQEDKHLANQFLFNQKMSIIREHVILFIDA